MRHSFVVQVVVTCDASVDADNVIEAENAVRNGFIGAVDTAPLYSVPGVAVSNMSEPTVHFLHHSEIPGKEDEEW